MYIVSQGLARQNMVKFNPGYTPNYKQGCKVEKNVTGAYDMS